jgi:UDP-N-acetylglucosamine--dolichyl-phosphate N-acetylglucosaminephosphotransferase
MRYLRRIGLVVKDMNKENTPLVPLSGGVAVVAGTIGGLMLFVFLRKFFFTTDSIITLDLESLMILFAAMFSMFLVTFIGFLDDLFIRKDKESSDGLKQWQKPILTLAAAVPLMIIGAGTTIMGLPFFGRVDVGILYPLLFVPIGVVGASNMVNMLAGFNGMETGIGIVAIGSLGLFAFFNGSYLAALIGLMVFISLIAFFLFNKYPAKILPGDSLTYMIGGTIAVLAIVGNIERAAIIVSIPFFIEFILKARKKFKADSYGYYYNGKIKSKYDKIYSLPHIFTRTGRFTEKQITFFMIAIELFFAALIWLV